MPCDLCGAVSSFLCNSCGNLCTQCHHIYMWSYTPTEEVGIHHYLCADEGYCTSSVCLCVCLSVRLSQLSKHTILTWHMKMTHAPHHLMDHTYLQLQQPPVSLLPYPFLSHLMYVLQLQKVLLLNKLKDYCLVSKLSPCSPGSR